MDILPQANMDEIKIKDTIYYYTVGKNVSNRNLSFRLEIYGVEFKTLRPINIVTVDFSRIIKESHLSIAHFAIHTVTGLKYNEKKKMLDLKRIRVWKIGD